MADLDTARFARHLLLPEIGKAGQERLLAARVCLSEGADAGAAEVAREYLTRAGVTFEEARCETVSVPETAAIEALAGCPELIEAARALAGALAAVESIKAVLNLGEPQSSARVVLSSEGP